MAAILHLPAEIRAQILSDVVNARSEPPPGPDLLRDDYLYEKDYRGRYWADQLCRPRYGKDWVYKSNTYGILETCRQLRLETLALLKETEYEVSVILVNEEALVPIWTYLPVKQHHLQKLTVTIWPYGPCIIGPSMLHPRSGDDWGTPKFGRHLYLLMERFFCLGPAPATDTDLTMAKTMWSVKELVIDVRTPSELAPGTILEDQYTSRLRAQRDETDAQGADPTATLSSTFLVRQINMVLLQILRPSYHTYKLGQMLLEGVGTMVLKLDGKPYQDYPLSRLAPEISVPFNYDLNGQRREEYREWRKRALVLRHERGFPLDDP